MDENQQSGQGGPDQQNNPPTNPSIGGPPQENKQESQRFSSAPTPEVNIRSMETDKKSVESGESAPVPESVQPPQNEKDPMFRPETQASDSFKGADYEKPPSKKGLIWTIIIILIVVIAVAVYFFVLPSGTNNNEQPPPPPPTQAPPPVAPTTHRSLFNPKPVSASEIRLNSLLVTSITNAMQALAANRLANDTVQEVAVFDEKGSQIPFGGFAATYINGLTTTQISNWFEDDFTAFLFYDQDGVWPGYVAKIKNGVNIDEVKVNLKAIETSDVGKFYLSPAGNFGDFKDGKVNNTDSRYNVGSSKGASFNYLFTNNFFVVSTSFNGLKTAAPLLGF